MAPIGQRTLNAQPFHYTITFPTDSGAIDSPGCPSLTDSEVKRKVVIVVAYVWVFRLECVLGDLCLLSGGYDFPFLDSWLEANSLGFPFSLSRSRVHASMRPCRCACAWTLVCHRRPELLIRVFSPEGRAVAQYSMTTSVRPTAKRNGYQSHRRHFPNTRLPVVLHVKKERAEHKRPQRFLWSGMGILLSYLQLKPTNNWVFSWSVLVPGSVARQHPPCR